MIGTLVNIGLVAAVGGVVAVVALWAKNYREVGNAPDATDRTSRKVVGVLSAAFMVLVVGVANFAGLLGMFGDVVAMSPETVGQVILGGLAVAGFAGWVEIGVVGGTILVLGVIAATAAIKN